MPRCCPTVSVGLYRDMFASGEVFVNMIKTQMIFLKLPGNDVPPFKLAATRMK